MQVLRTTTGAKVPNTTNLPNAGQLALNMADQILYSRDTGTNIFAIGANLVNQSVTNSSTITAGAVGVVPLTVKGAASATANLFQVSNSGSVIFAVNSVGVLVGNGFGLTSVTASVVANSGIVSNATGIYANIGSGLSFVSGAITATASGGAPFGNM